MTEVAEPEIVGVIAPYQNDKLTIVKHNNLNEAAYDLPLDARRLILSAIAKIRSKNEIVPEHITVYCEEFAKQWGLKSNNAYNQLKKARDVLYENSIRIKKLDNGEVWDVRWIDAAAYQDGEGYIKIAFSERIKPYLSNLESHFTIYRLAEIKNIKSTHAIRIYELLMQYKDTGWYQTEVETLKETLCISDKYSLWSEFKRNVVEKSISIINKQTIFNVRAEYMKRGRRVNQIRFNISKKPQRDMFLED